VLPGLQMTKEPIPKYIREGFSKRLTQALNARDFPVKKRNYELRTRYNSTQQAVNKWSHGVMPRIETLCAICDDLNINLTWLVTGKGTVNDVMTIDASVFQEIVIKTEKVIEEEGMQKIPAIARAKLYTKYYNVALIEKDISSSRIKEDLELLQAAIIEQPATKGYYSLD
jgi:transcriptional regulator with XRE-family HTH domain